VTDPSDAEEEEDDELDELDDEDEEELNFQFVRFFIIFYLDFLLRRSFLTFLDLLFFRPFFSVFFRSGVLDLFRSVDLPRDRSSKV